MTYKVPFKFHSTEVGRLNQSRILSVSRGFDQRGVVGGVFLLSGVIVCKGGCVFFVGALHSSFDCYMGCCQCRQNAPAALLITLEEA